MPRILEVYDKTKRRVYLTKERWTHILKHSEMTNALEHLCETLIYPDKIVQFTIDSSVHFYYKYYKSRQSYLFISVKYLNGTAYIITSFYTDKIK